MTLASRNGAILPMSTRNGGVQLSVRSSGQPVTTSIHPYEKINAAARAAYSVMMLGLADFDAATPKLKHKCHEIAIAVLDAAERFERREPQ